MDDPFLTALEAIVVGSVGLTSRALTEAASGIDLTFPQWRALLVVGAAEGGLRLGGIADRVGVTLPATTRLVRRLERRGLLSVAPDASDGRARRATLTPAGLAVRSSILAYRRGALVAVASRARAAGDVAALEVIAAAMTAFA
jgi:DNA-binding MarR family transcriptional regulator